MRNGAVSHWWADLGGPPAKRAPLTGPTEADVVIVGAGYTGLWTAWYIKEAQPGWRIVVLEREHAGFGASGRNGGWLSGLLAGSRERWAEQFGREGVIAAQRAMFATVEEVADWCVAQDVDCDLVRSGSLDVATSAPALARLRAKVSWQRDWTFGEEDWRELGPDEVRRRVRVHGARGGVFTPHCARVHPAKLARGLADAVVRAGVELYEDTAVTAIEPRVARTARGDVRARWVVRATEGYTHGLDHRRLVPMNSAMIATAPLTAEQWAQIGWEGEETLRDAAHAFCYLQRSADGRIAIGGRGVPYRFGSNTDRAGEVDPRTATELAERLHKLLGVDAPPVHAWAGVLGVARDWCPAVTADAITGLATAGGYVGDGVSTANLAGRTLRDRILGRDTALARAPWTRHAPPRWEPEPLRFVGIHAVYGLYRAADRVEARTQRPSRFGALATLVAGR
ncbi:MAG: FAD-dependent oxidoreductase [Solirubrobacteraceae bacterium]